MAALLHRPKLLLCDEPTVGVDPQSRNAIFDFLEARAREGLTVIYSTHYMEEAAQLARAHKGVHLHSHLAEELDEETYCARVYGMRSVDFAESVGWLGPDVWFAHAIFVNDQEIKTFAETGTGMTHCPSAAPSEACRIASIGVV